MVVNYHEIGSPYICYRLFATGKNAEISWTSECLEMSMEQHKRYLSMENGDEFLYSLVCPSITTKTESQFDAIFEDTYKQLEELKQMYDNINKQYYKFSAKNLFSLGNRSKYSLELDYIVKEFQQFCYLLTLLVEKYPHRFRVSFLESKQEKCNNLCTKMETMEKFASLLTDRMVYLLTCRYGKERIRKMLKSDIPIVHICISCLRDEIQCNDSHRFNENCSVRFGPGNTYGVSFEYLVNGVLSYNLPISSKELNSIFTNK